MCAPIGRALPSWNGWTGLRLLSRHPCLATRRYKVLYRKIHAQHHAHEADLTVFGTAHMHMVEAFGLTMSFYGLLIALYYYRVCKGGGLGGGGGPVCDCWLGRRLRLTWGVRQWAMSLMSSL
jgi:hypothetical protein